MVTQESIQQAAFSLRQKLTLDEGAWIGVLVGGHSNRLSMKGLQMERVVNFLSEWSQEKGFKILVATSRRTPREVEILFEKAMGAKPFARLLFAKDFPDNPIPGVLGIAQWILVTEDSFSMLMEAVHSGRPVVTLRLNRRGFKKLKYEATLRALEKEGRIMRSSVRHLKKIVERLAERGFPLAQAANSETNLAVSAILKLVNRQDG